MGYAKSDFSTPYLLRKRSRLTMVTVQEERTYQKSGRTEDVFPPFHLTDRWMSLSDYLDQLSCGVACAKSNFSTQPHLLRKQSRVMLTLSRVNTSYIIGPDLSIITRFQSKSTKATLPDVSKRLSRAIILRCVVR